MIFRTNLERSRKGEITFSNKCEALCCYSDGLKCNRCCVAIVTVQGAEMFDMSYLAIVGCFGKKITVLFSQRAKWLSTEYISIVFCFEI